MPDIKIELPDGSTLEVVGRARTDGFKFIDSYKIEGTVVSVNGVSIKPSPIKEHGYCDSRGWSNSCTWQGVEYHLAK